jgi:hypothetical protein
VSTAGASALIVSEEAFAQLPDQLRADLLESFEEMVRNYSEGRWGAAELDGAKLCEAALSICQGLCTGAMPARAQKPSNIVRACQALEKHTSAPRSIRIQVPRMVMALYEVRNNRNVGHLGGDVDPSHMDATYVVHASKWIVAELVRVLHQLPVDEAAQLVEALVERQVPLVWMVGGRRRVLDARMGNTDKALVLLHGRTGPVHEADLADWVEHNTLSHFRRDVLKPLHKKKLIEYSAAERMAVISPLGIERVESKLLRQQPRAVAA